MPSYKRPGVFVEETLTPLDARDTQAGAAIAAFVGTYSRGQTKPVFVSSYTDFANQYGALDPNYDLGFAVFQFFGNGGRGCWINRVVGSGAAAASLTLADRASGSPVSTLTATAISPGLWGNKLYIAIADGAAGRFDLAVYVGGTLDSNIIEVFTDLSMNKADGRYVVSIVNSQSEVITLTDLNSATAAPDNRPSVRAANGTNAVFSGGLDGAGPSGSDYLASVQQYDTVESPLVFNIPGITAAGTLNPIIAYCEARADVFLVIDPGVGRSPAQILSDTSSLSNSSYAAVYYPRLVIPDPIATQPNVLRTIPPGASIVGRICQIDISRGPFKAPAGIDVKLSNAVATERLLSPTDLDNLYDAHPPVNPIRPLPGAGVCVMGSRTLRQGYADKYVPVRRSLIYIRKSLIDLTQFALFEPNDERLWARLRDVVGSWLQGYYQRGGLRGANPSEAFYVKCDASINKPASIAAGIVNVEIGVAVQYPAEYVVIKLGQYEGGASLTEVN